MRRRSALFAVIAALLAAFTMAVAHPARSATAPVRIMPLGDSITSSPGCWRAILWHELQSAGYTNIDFVGTQSDQGSCNYGYTYDENNEGHAGYSATGIAAQNDLPAWLAADMPDIVLMHLGTNDMWGDYIPTSSILAAYTTLIGQMRANNPNVKILVAQIIPMNPPSCTACASEVVALDQAIPGWAAGLTTSQSPIIAVDQWTGFDDATDTIDGVHPNDAGDQKMADRWYTPLSQILGGIIPPPPTTSTSSTPPPTTSSGGSTCTAAYQVVSQWTGGFQGSVTVTNGSAAASTGWTVTFTFADGQQVTQSWNTTLTQSGAAVTAKNASYNGSLAAGASTSFGFTATWNNTANTAPAAACTLS